MHQHNHTFATYCKGMPIQHSSVNSKTGLVKMNKLLLIVAVAFISLYSNAQQEASYKLSKKIDLPGDGKWDYMSVDNARSRLYVSHGDRVHIIDLATDKAIAEWTGLEKVHGLAFNEATNKVYVANTGLDNVVIYDAVTLKKLNTVELPEGKKPDCILFDTHSQKAFVFCGKSNNVIIIDGKTDAVVSTLALGGKPEFACTDDKGFIYNNLEDKNEVVVIDAKNNKVVNRFSLGDNKAPTGIAIDKKNDRLFVACEESERMVVLSKTTGKIIATVPMGSQTDGLIYEKNTHLVITSDGAGSATVIKQNSPDTYTVLQTLTTQAGLKTISYEEKTHRFFITGAAFKEDGKTIAPGTFGVYIYSNN